LNLQKRTVAETEPAPAARPADPKSNPFGAARPIDTAAREREVKSDAYVRERKLKKKQKQKRPRRLRRPKNSDSPKSRRSRRKPQQQTSIVQKRVLQRPPRLAKMSKSSDELVTMRIVVIKNRPRTPRKWLLLRNHRLRKRRVLTCHRAKPMGTGGLLLLPPLRHRLQKMRAGALSVPSNAATVEDRLVVDLPEYQLSSHHPNDFLRTENFFFSLEGSCEHHQPLLFPC